MEKLATWLPEQIAADARRAELASGERWQTGVVPRTVHVVQDGSRKWRQLGFVATTEHDDYAEHIATWDPARVVAECDARQRRVETARILLGRDEYSVSEAGWAPVRRPRGLPRGVAAMTAALSCVTMQSALPHGGCCYVESVAVHHPQADERLRRTPGPPCWAEANGAAVKVPICRRHADLIQALHLDHASLDGAAG